MIARSGKQNIAEGSAAAATSSETELKLMNVARASFQELLTDYEDYLRVRDLEQWTADDPRSIKTRQVSIKHNDSGFYRDAIKKGMMKQLPILPSPFYIKKTICYADSSSACK